MAQLLFVSVFCPNGKARIIAVTADAIMGNQFVGQPVQTQGQIEIGSVFADPRIIPSQSVTVRIAAAAKIRRLAFRIAKADSLIVVLCIAVACQLVITYFISLIPVFKGELSVAADGCPFYPGPDTLSWISSVDNEKRCEFVETLFGLISSCGVKNLSDISVDRFKSTREVIKQYANLDKDSRTLLRSMLLSLTDQIGKARLEK